MTKRVLLLDDDEIERVLRWRISAQLAADEDDPDDEELAEKIAAARLAS